jgi:hypothetical protein
MKLAGFLVLLALTFVAAYAAGTRLGPVTTGHSQVQYTGGGSGGSTMSTGGASGDGMNMGGMNMSGSP